MTVRSPITLFLKVCCYDEICFGERSCTQQLGAKLGKQLGHKS